jgi:NDP-sugar pyrophosphorylase family protein
MNTAIILAGGLGSRLHPYTLTIPKPLLPLGGTPIIEIVIKQLSRQGFKRIIVSIGYLGEMIKIHLGDGTKFDVNIEYVSEDNPLGTAGSLFLIKNLPEKFIVMNGDLLTSFPFNDLLESLNFNQVKAAVACHNRNVQIEYGVLKKDSNNRLEEYVEKPTLSYLVSMGIYAFDVETLTLLIGEKIDMPTFLDKIRSEKGGVHVFESHHYWKDIGRIQDFEQASQDFESNPIKFIEGGPFNEQFVQP